MTLDKGTCKMTGIVVLILYFVKALTDSEIFHGGQGDRKNEVTNNTCGNFEHPYFLEHQGEVDDHNFTTDEAPAALLSPHLQAVQVGVWINVEDA